MKIKLIILEKSQSNPSMSKYFSLVFLFSWFCGFKEISENNTADKDKISHFTVTQTTLLPSLYLDYFESTRGEGWYRINYHFFSHPDGLFYN